MNKILMAICVLFSVLPVLEAGNFTPQSVPNPKLLCADCYVSNPSGILSQATERLLNGRLSRLEAASGVEMAVVVLPSVEGGDEYAFAHQLFNAWRVGKEGKDNGVLILFVQDIRAVKIETGYGVEGLLPDAFCEEVLNDVMFPLFKRGDYDEGFVSGVDALSARLTTDEALSELLLNARAPQTRYVSYVADYLMFGFLLLILCVWAVYFQFKKLKGTKSERYVQLRLVKNILAACTVFFPFHLLFLLNWVKRKRKGVRYDTFPCPQCGSTMSHMSEEEEDAHLSYYQMEEDDLKSIDYDVWQCPKCFFYEIFPYENIFSPYTKCPDCGSKAYKLESDVVAKNPTAYSKGEGQKIYYCKACMKRTVKKYDLPKLGTSTAFVVGSGGGGFRGTGGGFGGGSFGGGFSGGGGAGGRF